MKTKELILDECGDGYLNKETLEAMDIFAKQQSVSFCKWFMELKVEDLTYYIIEKGIGNPIPQYYSREEMYDKFLQSQYTNP